MFLPDFSLPASIASGDRGKEARCGPSAEDSDATAPSGIRFPRATDIDSATLLRNCEMPRAWESAARIRDVAGARCSFFLDRCPRGAPTIGTLSTGKSQDIKGGRHGKGRYVADPQCAGGERLEPDRRLRW